MIYNNFASSRQQEISPTPSLFFQEQEGFRKAIATEGTSFLEAPRSGGTKTGGGQAQKMDYREFLSKI
jgi:hypothetical protein